MTTKYFFKLTSSSVEISLPYTLKNASKIKINFVKYTTASNSQSLMMFKINSFNENVYYDGTDIHKCVKILSLPDTSGTQLIYENTSQDFDVIINNKSANSGLTKINIETLIDFNYSSDISPSNPVYLEIIIL
jgi:hypothetical protein